MVENVCKAEQIISQIQLQPQFYRRGSQVWLTATDLRSVPLEDTQVQILPPVLSRDRTSAWLERVAHNHFVLGSNPSGPIWTRSLVWIKQGASNPQIEDSNSSVSVRMEEDRKERYRKKIRALINKYKETLDELSK